MLGAKLGADDIARAHCAAEDAACTTQPAGHVPLLLMTAPRHGQLRCKAAKAQCSPCLYCVRLPLGRGGSPCADGADSRASGASYLRVLWPAQQLPPELLFSPRGGKLRTTRSRACALVWITTGRAPNGGPVFYWLVEPSWRECAPAPRHVVDHPARGRRRARSPPAARPPSARARSRTACRCSGTT